jgi:hypothetical protein
MVVSAAGDLVMNYFISEMIVLPINFRQRDATAQPEKVPYHTDL